MRIALALLIGLFSTTLWAEIPHRIESKYDILVKGVKLAEVREVFTHDGNEFHIQAITKPVGLLALFKPETISVISEGTIGSTGLQPTKFTQKRVSDTKMNSAAEFDWAHHELTHRDNAGLRQLDLAVGTQDRLSMMYQFVAAPPRGKLELKFDMSNGSRIEKLHYQIKPEQTVTTSFGTMRSYNLTSLPFNVPKKSEIWLAIDHNFVPCKVVFTEDGSNSLVQVLTDLKIFP
ncbi:MAG: DUF3108 domain-containing protein [Sideroxydans sp.]|nr:DUF3108 domain-containing protein [Sideroxydans sp.]